MTKPEHFELRKDYAHYQPIGHLRLQEAVNLCSQAISFSREHKIRKLLVDSRQLTGFAPPSTMERFDMAEKWAAAARSSLTLAVVAHPEMIDPHRFAMTVARNRGLFANVFDSEDEAIAWLLDPNAK